MVYWVGIWLPLLVPAAVMAVVEGIDITPAGGFRKLVQVLYMSLLYGGIPYGVLAAGASLWMVGRGEDQIRQLMRRAPLLMAGFFAIVSALLGLIVGAPGPFLALAALGALFSVALGYVYVGVVLMLRRLAR